MRALVESHPCVAASDLMITWHVWHRRQRKTLKDGLCCIVLRWPTCLSWWGFESLWGVFWESLTDPDWLIHPALELQGSLIIYPCFDVLMHIFIEIKQFFFWTFEILCLFSNFSFTHFYFSTFPPVTLLTLCFRNYLQNQEVCCLTFPKGLSFQGLV